LTSRKVLVVPAMRSTRRDFSAPHILVPFTL
jgi:hypothetical protein